MDNNSSISVWGSSSACRVHYLRNFAGGNVIMEALLKINTKEAQTLVLSFRGARLPGWLFLSNEAPPLFSVELQLIGGGSSMQTSYIFNALRVIWFISINWQWMLSESCGAPEQIPFIPLKMSFVPVWNDKIPRVKKGAGINYTTLLKLWIVFLWQTDNILPAELIII